MPALAPARIALISYTSNQTWTGSAGALALVGTSGQFTEPQQVWTGTAGALALAGTSGAFTGELPGYVSLAFSADEVSIRYGRNT